MAGDNVTGTLILPASQFESLAATGTPPLIVASATVVTDLNADLLDGFHGSDYRDAGKLTGTLANARVPQSAVTQHQGALAIAATQVTSGTLPSGRLAGAYTGITEVGTLTALTVSGTVAFNTPAGGTVRQFFREAGADKYVIGYNGIGVGGDGRFGIYDFAASQWAFTIQGGVIGVGGAVSPGASAGDIVTISNRGYVCTTPDGSKRYRLSVSNAGALTITLL